MGSSCVTQTQAVSQCESEANDLRSILTNYAYNIPGSFQYAKCKINNGELPNASPVTASNNTCSATNANGTKFSWTYNEYRTTFTCN
jgi:hypothetical protein